MTTISAHWNGFAAPFLNLQKIEKRMIMDLGLAGRKALVTGGERGIGRDICLALAREGVDIAYADIHLEMGGESTQACIRKFGRTALALEVDIADEDQVIHFVQAAIAELGSIDIFVSNAGIIEWEPITKITLACWNRILAVNLTGAMLCTREVARHMVTKRKGVMLFTSSTIQFNPAYKEAAYRVSKTGVQVFAETAAIELAPYGIRVNTVSPGLINSPNWAKGVLPKVANDPATGEGFMGNIPLGRLGRPEDVGAAYAFLASDLASFATGTNIVFDGGFTLRPLVLVSQDEIRNMNL
jgi:NAD(P)-dependent dehydrogenase (short-subunit alcohol dehydrogenase family)